jgi:peptidoglycan/xylan/chitin deacetylase (PgdA/CDA1 family)
MRERTLAPDPPLLYPVKAALTRVRSASWRVRSGGRPDTSGLRILLYHRISTDDDDELAIAPRRFREQMDFLSSEGYQALALGQAVGLLARGELPPRTVALTFDDGYLDVAEVILPLLEERGFSATVFVVTKVVDGEARLPWYRHQPPMLTWEDVFRLDREGCLRFEAHTLTHPNLPALDVEAARIEIAGSKAALEARLGRGVEAFSYPAGRFGARERWLVEEAGFRMAVTCEPGVNRRATDLYALCRRQIDPRDRLLDYRAKIGGGHDSPLPFSPLYRRLRYGPS